ncbi:STAS domain-containing protein [Streptomyces sp. SGAir0957]
MDITTELNGHRATLTPHGDIDFDTLDQVQAGVACLPTATTHVVFDLSDVPFVDIAGLRLFDSSRNFAHVTVVHPNPQALRVLRLAVRLFPHMDFERHLSEADRSQVA